MKLVVALALLSNAAAFLAPVTPRAGQAATRDEPFSSRAEMALLASMSNPTESPFSARRTGTVKGGLHTRNGSGMLSEVLGAASSLQTRRRALFRPCDGP